MAPADTEQKDPQRAFIHDISTPLAVAVGMLDLVVDDSTSGVTVLPAAAAKRLEKAQAALLRLQEMLVARRKILIEESEPKS